MKNSPTIPTTHPSPQGDALDDLPEIYAAIFENTNESILFLSLNLNILHFNKTARDRFLHHSGREIYTGAPLQEFAYPGTLGFLEEIRTTTLQLKSLDRELHVRLDNKNSFWLRARSFPTRNKEGELIGITLLTEHITDRKVHEQQMLSLSRTYRFISEINEAMLRSDTESEIFNEACNIAVTHGNCRMAWIGLKEKGKENVVPLTWAGHEDGYLQSITIAPDNPQLGRGPTGRCVKTRSLQYCNDIATDPSMLPWREEALKRNYHSSVSIPIVVNNQLSAIFTLYMSEADFFNEKEIKLLDDVAKNIAFALDKIRIRNLKAKADEELRESEEKFRTLVEGAAMGVFIMQEGKFIYTNASFSQLLGYSPSELLQNLSPDHFIQENFRTDFIHNYLQSIKENTKPDQFKTKVIKQDGSILDVELMIAGIHYKGELALIGTMVDITEALQEERRISKAVINAQENERQIIGMELHDNVKQIMAAALLNVDFMKVNLHNEQTTTQIIERVSRYIREAIDDLRKISHRLSPTVDNALSIQEKIHSLVNSMNVNGQIQVEYEFSRQSFYLPADLQLTLYRILQEQFTNILRYAEARNVKIELRKSRSLLIMKIEDDGKGFDPRRRKNGIGLENIKRRVMAYNGKLDIISAPGNGCKLIMQVPLGELAAQASAAKESAGE